MFTKEYDSCMIILNNHSIHIFLDPRKIRITLNFNAFSKQIKL